MLYLKKAEIRTILSLHIVSELNYSLMPSHTRYSLLYVTKVELNDVIETIAEIDDD